MMILRLVTQKYRQGQKKKISNTSESSVPTETSNWLFNCFGALSVLCNANDRNDKKYCFWTWCSAHESHITKPCTGQINSTSYGNCGPCTLLRTTGVKVRWVRLCKQQNIHWRIHRRRKLSVRPDQLKDFYKLRTGQALNILSGLLIPAPFCDLNYMNMNTFIVNPLLYAWASQLMEVSALVFSVESFSVILCFLSCTKLTHNS
jgi:hypothetical protein